MRGCRRSGGKWSGGEVLWSAAPEHFLKSRHTSREQSERGDAGMEEGEDGRHGEEDEGEKEDEEVEEVFTLLVLMSAMQKRSCCCGCSETKEGV